MSTVVIVLVALGLLGAAVVLLRSSRTHPWAAIVVAMVASGIAFTVGGGSTAGAGPSIATVVASVVGSLSLAAAVVALVPRSPDRPPSRLPMYLACGAIVVAAVGLVLDQVLG